MKNFVIFIILVIYFPIHLESSIIHTKIVNKITEARNCVIYELANGDKYIQKDDIKSTLLCR